MVFYEFVESASAYKFEEEKGTTEKGIPLAGGMLPNQIVWDNDLLYISNKKQYFILKKADGSIVQTVSLKDQPYPQICLYKNKCLILNENNYGFFVD